MTPLIDPQLIRRGDRRALGKAITLIESSHPDHRHAARELLTSLLPQTGGSLRLAISGVPGVGKSTFIEVFGQELLMRGRRIAVLTIDPSSPVSGGSILGDKTRMTELSRDPRVFIRPSPARGVLGGVAEKTHEAMLLCEAAGFDVVIIETVGVGQSEVLSAQMVDFLLVLLLPNAGDELQGLKKGLFELAHAFVVNKADGDQRHAAEVARSNLEAAFKLLPLRNNRPAASVLTCSAREKTQISELVQRVLDYEKTVRANGYLQAQRATHNRHWFERLVQEALLQRLKNTPAQQQMWGELEQAVTQAALTPLQASELFLEKISSVRSENS